LNPSCNVILDLIPLVKDGAASEDSTELVMKHIENCGSCQSEYENYVWSSRKAINDKKVLFSIKKKLFLVTSALLGLGACLGLALNGQTAGSLAAITISGLTIFMVGRLIFKSGSEGDEGMRRFFVGKAIGTVIIFGGLGVYLLLKYVLHLF